MKKIAIFNLFNTKNNPLTNLLDEKMDGKTALKLFELTEKLEKEFRLIEKVRQKLLKDIFEVDEKTGKVLDLDNKEKMEKFTSELNKILEEEVEFKKIDVNSEGISIKPKDIILLKELINFK